MMVTMYSRKHVVRQLIISVKYFYNLFQEKPEERFFFLESAIIMSVNSHKVVYFPCSQPYVSEYEVIKELIYSK